jgi:hypothetical protein
MPRLVVFVVIASLLAACGSDASPSPSAVAAASNPPPSAVPSASRAAATATPTAKPTARPAARWSSPSLVSSESCDSMRAGIDSAGRTHVVASCDGLLYAVMKSDGSWAQTRFPLAANRLEVNPQLAFQGNVTYMAYSRLAVPDDMDTCGGDADPYIDIGVFYRKRAQPSGDWSAPVRMGRSDDKLVQFRVDGTTLHAIVSNQGDGREYYLLVKGTTSKRFALPTGGESLRIGSDGRARIASGGDAAIRIATFTGSGFSTVKVQAPDSGRTLLVLDGRDRSHLVWVRDGTDYSGCGGDIDPNLGIYYATNATGTWHSERLTHELGDASFQVDRSTGDVHLVISTESALTYYTKASRGVWKTEKLPPRQARSPAIARDATTGRVLILYIDEGGSGIYMMSKGG